MTTIIPEGITPTGERIERVIPNVGAVVFENYGPGEWFTKKGEPAKKARRRYLLNDEEVDAVSSIGDALRKAALERWIEDHSCRGAVQAERMGELADVPEEDYHHRVRLLGLGASAKRDEGADRGTVIHAALDGLAKGIVPNPAEFPGTARPWVQGAMRAWLALGDGDTVASEEIVAHPELRYGGRPDIVRYVEGRLTLLDYKTGKARIFDNSHFTTRLYAMALARCGVEVERVLLVGIDDAGGFQFVECAATEEHARALLTVHRARKLINSDMASQRAIAKAAA